ncbi:MAG: deoxyhypusine synthase family protein [Abditibacteriales bacterium]|nr:deoxyhypusine synthase family protein [Abditibacteriales bacterium]MDW8364603.1 deoxyhypusine synthase family protein [Abditibacteriales bacterium]
MQHAHPCGARTDLHDGFSDNLTPTVPLDLSQIRNFDDLLRAMSQTAFGGRQLGEAADVLYEMVTNPRCFVVGTFAGAMTVAKMGLVLCDMIEQGMLQAVISTGALMAHGFVEASGGTHFKYDATMDDRALYYKGYNRVYDTLELEKNLDDVEEIFHVVLAGVPEDEVLCSYKINRLLGEYLVKNTQGRGILKSAYERNVPVFVPAFTDSEIGLDFALFNRKRQLAGKPWLAFNPFLDLEHYTELIRVQEEIGIFTIGGGVPRNWGQQVGPYLEIITKRLGEGGAFKRFKYGVRICPEPAHWGGLSGCTYAEGVSWGKFVPPSEGGRFAEVLCDATIAWPLLVKAVQERLMVNG